MRTRLASLRLLATIALLLFLTAAGAAQSISPDSYAAMRWRLVGPFHRVLISAEREITLGIVDE